MLWARMNLDLNVSYDVYLYQVIGIVKVVPSWKFMNETIL